MTKLINKNRLTLYTSQLWDKISKSFVHKTKENLVTGKTTLLDGRLLHNALSVVNNTGAIHHINGNSSWCGSPNLTVSANNKISYVCIAVKDDLEIGTELNNIKLAAVKSSDNQVYRILTVDSALVVKNTLGHIDSSKMIMVPVNTAFDTQVYFITGFNGMKWGNTPSGSNWLTISPEGRAFPEVGTTLKTNLTNYVPQWFVLSEELSLNDVVTSVNTKASKNASNIFDSTNTFNGNVKLNDTVNVKYKHYIQQPLLGSDNTKGSAWVVYFDRNVYIPAGSHVTYLDIRVTNDVSDGSYLSNIHIYEVHRGNSINNDSIVSVNNSRRRVTDVTGYGKCIRIQLDRTFERDTYYIIGQRERDGKILIGGDDKENIRHAIIENAFVLNPSHTISSKASPTNDKVIHRYNIERVGVLQDDIRNINNVLATTVKNTDVANKPNKIPIIGEDGRLPSSILPPEQNGGVRTVNRQSPVDGNVTVYSENINLSNSDTRNIKTVLDTKVEKNSENTFTQKNTFNYYSPKVNRVFARASFRDNLNTSSITAYTDSNAIYFANLSDKYNKPNKPISHLILPIKNARVGDTVSARCFVYNNINTVLQIQNWFKNYTVEDIDMVGCKCIKIPFDYTPTGAIGFGFAIEQNNRGLGAACVRNSSGIHSWTNSQNPQRNETIRPNNSNISFPYKICYETTSELVTRFELEEVSQMYPRNLIGEMKQLAYDGGEVIEENNCTWLRADGQSISQEEYPELYVKMQTETSLISSFKRSNAGVTIPNLNNNRNDAGYYYICAK